ncbi:MAG: TIR domain-containing protein [Gammaproteobacteria bacterium]
MDEPVQIFISYATEDWPHVSELYDRLRKEGFRPWVDRESILPGQDLKFSITRAISESDFILICLSKHTVSRRGYLQQELKAGLDIWEMMQPGELFLIPVLLEPCEVPESLRRFQWVQLYEPGGWERLLMALRGGAERRRRASFESVLQASSLREIADVADRLEGAVDVPSDQRQLWRTAVRKFDQASAAVGQYLALHSEYRKGEALNEAAAVVESLVSLLVTAQGLLAPRLLRIAERWQELIQSERESFRSSAEATPETPNPFVFGTPVAETEYNLFSGRQDVVRQIEESILGARQSPTLLLHGSRRMGKTSILNQLPRLLGHRFSPAVVDCQNPAIRHSAQTLLRYLARKISEGLLRRSVSVEAPAEEAFAAAPFNVFDAWLDEVERVATADTRVLLCLDEYEKLHAMLKYEWGSQVLDYLRHVIQHSRRIVLMFTGAHTFAEVGPAWTDRFINARRIRVSFLKRDEVIPLLTKPIPEFDITYEPDALEKMFTETNGQPFLTQALAFELVQFLKEQRLKRATAADVEEAVARALSSGDSYFNNVWNDAGSEGQAILRAVAAGVQPPFHPEAISWLRRHDVLDSVGQFAVPMLRRWVKENA